MLPPRAIFRPLFVHVCILLLLTSECWAFLASSVTFKAALLQNGRNLGISSYRMLKESSESLGSSEKNFQPESRYWNWKNGWKIHYQECQAGGSPVSNSERGSPVLLLSGFGVGGFHWQRNIPGMTEDGLRVWTMDVLGQGKSWPTVDPAPDGEQGAEKGFEWGFGRQADESTNAAELTYSCTMWRNQTIDFIEQIVREPVFIAGNSLGGYLATMIACERPELVRGMFLINPTPWWGVGPQRLLPWNGGYPVPSWVRPLTVTWWDTLRRPSTISLLLSQVYANKDRVGDQLVNQIIAPTEQPAAASAFASILCSPGSSIKFDDMLRISAASRIPIALCYGKEDPWIVPVWGHRAKRLLPESTPYIELSPAGHCPHHETPEAVNKLLVKWIQGVNDGMADGGLNSFVAVGDEKIIESCVAGCDKSIRLRAYDATPRTLLERVDDVVWRLTQSSSSAA